ncbi:sulfotransferase family protein [Hyphomicrobium sp. DY-1]|uniref:sulfotransferase family protein n=1 Tax=Hyphomicrobium sp. DY-1 TaxID=3075650 RepID=UPI0039C44BBF
MTNAQLFGNSCRTNLPPQEDQVSSQSKRVCILVLGMHRSGTSALTRVLNIAGAKLPNCLIGAGVGNELGHWEPARLASYHDELLQELNSHWSDWRTIDWGTLPLSRRQQIKSDIVRHLEDDYGDGELIVLKEPRICRFTPFFLEALDKARYDVRIILPLRNPLEIADSLRTRGDLGPAETMHYHSSLLWLRHVLDAEIATRDIPRAIISYDSLLSNWRETLAFLSRRLRVNWPNSPDEIDTRVQEFLASERRHHLYSTEDLYLHENAFNWLTQTYETMLTLQHNPYSKNALQTLDQIRRQFNDLQPVLVGLLAEKQRTFEAAIEKLNNSTLHDKTTISHYEDMLQSHRDEITSLQRRVDRRKTWLRKVRRNLFKPMTHLLTKEGRRSD